MAVRLFDVPRRIHKRFKPITLWIEKIDRPSVTMIRDEYPLYVFIRGYYIVDLAQLSQCFAAEGNLVHRRLVRFRFAPFSYNNLMMISGIT